MHSELPRLWVWEWDVLLYRPFPAVATACALRVHVAVDATVGRCETTIGCIISKLENLPPHWSSTTLYIGALVWPREEGLAHPADTSISNLAAALALLNLQEAFEQVHSHSPLSPQLISRGTHTHAALTVCTGLPSLSF